MLTLIISVLIGILNGVLVGGQPTLNVDFEMKNTTKYKGEIVRLRCEISGNPFPKYSWFKDSIEIGDKEDRFNVKLTPWGSRLKIEKSVPHDSGYYMCIAANRAGNKNATAYLQIKNEHPPKKDNKGGGSKTDVDSSFPDLGDDTDRFSGKYDPEIYKKLKEESSGSTKDDSNGFCQPFRGNMCARFIGNQTIYVNSEYAQGVKEEKFIAAFTVIAASSDMSAECQKYAIEFLCFYTFPLCDRQHINPTPRKVCRDECEMLEGTICKKEYVIGRHHPMIGEGFLPKCYDLPPRGTPEGDKCKGINVPIDPTQRPEVHTCYGGNGMKYKGSINHSRSGRPCMNWKNNPHFKGSEYPDLGNHHLCRNPNGTYTGPWCYTDPSYHHTELCDIPKCGAPFLNYDSLTITSIKGKHVVLPCVVKNLGFSSIIWFSPSGGAIAKDTHLYSQDDRISVQHPYKTDYNLVIDNIRESDAGIYICMVLGGQSEKHVTLKVQSPPTLDVQRSTPNLKIVMEGDTLSLTCAATGKPEPVISWYRTVETDSPEQTKEDLGTTGTVLSINDIAREAAGSYECVASNNLPPNVSREIIVTVHYKPQIYPQNDQVTKKPGKTVIFECVAEGYPLPQVVWRRNGNIISRTEPSNKFRQDVYEDKDSIILSLRINYLDDNDFGTYTCEAENKYGSSAHDYTLEKTGAPKIAVASSLVRKMKSENGDLECRVRGFPWSVVWFKNGEKLSTSASRRYAIETYQEDDVTVSSLTIVSLETSDFAVYVCQADNEFGSDEMEIRLEQSVIDISGPVEGKVGKDITLVCNATSDTIGKDGIVWLKNGQRLVQSARVTTSRDINTDDKRIYSKLFINKMKLGDKGTYTCRTLNLLVKSHSLSITQVPDDFVNIDKSLSSPTDVIRKENSGPIKLMCKVEAFPRIMIFWYKYIGESDGRKQYTEIASGDEVLTFDSHRSVAGTYQCRATNGKQSEETLDIDVDIQYPVKVSVSSRRIKKEIGMSLIAECNITGNPIIYNYWVSPKGPNSTFDHTLDIVPHENYMTMAMKIMKLNIEDFGQYTCVGGNHLGQDSVSVTILPLFATTTKPMTTTEKMIKKPTTTIIILTSTKEPITPVPIIITTKPMEKVTKKRKPKRTTTPAIPTAETEYREADKEQVKQDNRNKSSVMTTSYILLTVTVVFAFQKLFS